MAAPKESHQRLKRDYMKLMKNPIPYIQAAPLPSNMLEWHYVMTGPEKTPYHGGYYHGKLIFPSEYPFKAPKFYIITPNGRFETNRSICLSTSSLHPESWNPSNSVSSLLTGFLSFMLEDTDTLGSVKTTDAQKRELARKSLEFNLKNATFCDLFPELVDKIKGELEAQPSPLTTDGTTAGGARAAPVSDPDRSWIDSPVANLVCVVLLFFLAWAAKKIIEQQA
eukprot:Opistho-2@94222